MIMRHCDNCQQTAIKQIIFVERGKYRAISFGDKQIASMSIFLYYLFVSNKGGMIW